MTICVTQKHVFSFFPWKDFGEKPKISEPTNETLQVHHKYLLEAWKKESGLGYDYGAGYDCERFSKPFVIFPIMNVLKNVYLRLL